MNSFLLRIFRLLLLLLLVAYNVHADIIYFKNGKKIEAERVWADGGMIKCIVYGGEVSFHPADIERVEISDSTKPKKTVTTSKKKNIDNEKPARNLALEAYDLASSNPDGGPGRIQVEKLLERARTIDPNEAEIYLAELILILQDGYNLGTWYRSSTYAPGTVEKAIILARKSIEADPQYSKGYAILAWMMIAEENYTEAELLLQKAYSLKKESAYSWF